MRAGAVWAALLLLASACVVAAPPPPPPPPPPRVLAAPQAVAIATHYARSRGLVIDYTQDVRLDRFGRWHVDLGGAGGRDRALVTIDGFSGGVLAARLRGPGGAWVPQPPPAAPGGAPQTAPPTTPQPSAPPSPPPAPPPPPSSG
ncbi:MAG TPA: hypothetical protein VM753_06690 [Anaeromyxobacter sp.]|jgi:hypothetical protein|nr:hypothetical protein [Anaeromyxobacter sp.]